MFDEAGFDEIGFDEIRFDEVGFEEVGFDEAGFDEIGFDGIAEEIAVLLVPPLYLFQRAMEVAMNKRAIIAGLKPRTFEITIKDK